MRKSTFLTIFLFLIILIPACSKKQVREKGYTYSEKQEYYDVLQRRNENFDSGNHFDENLIKMVEEENNRAMSFSIQNDEKKEIAEKKQQKLNYVKNRAKLYQESEKNKNNEKNKGNEKKTLSVKELNNSAISPKKEQAQEKKDNVNKDQKKQTQKKK